MQFIRNGAANLDPIFHEFGFNGYFHYVDLINNSEQDLELAIDLPILAFISGRSIVVNFFDFEHQQIRDCLIQPQTFMQKGPEFFAYASPTQQDGQV